MLSIRLSRVGKRKAPLYRLIVTEKARDPWGKYLENLGSYEPTAKKAVLNVERINYWLSQGAQASPTVYNLLITQGITKGQKVRASKSQPGKKKQAQIDLQKKAEADKKAAELAAQAAAKAAAEQPAATPTETTPTETPATENKQ